MTTVADSLADKIEIAALKCENYKLQAQAELQRLSDATNALVQQARAEVQAPDGHVYDTETRAFRDPKGATPLSTATSRQARRAEARKARPA